MKINFNEYVVCVNADTQTGIVDGGIYQIMGDKDYYRINKTGRSYYKNRFVSLLSIITPDEARIINERLENNGGGDGDQ